MFTKKIEIYNIGDWEDVTIYATGDLVETFMVDETLDSAILSLKKTNLSKTFAPYIPIRTTFYENSTKKETNYYLIYNDVVEKDTLLAESFTHTLTLIEPTKMLERILLPNKLAFTRIEGAIEYTIADVIERIIKTSLIQEGSAEVIPLQLESNDFLTLSLIPAPDFNFDGRNLFEALMEVGRYVNMIPVLNISYYPTYPYYLSFTPVPENNNIDAINMGTKKTIEPEQMADNYISDIKNLVVKDLESSSIQMNAIPATCYPGEELTERSAKVFLPSEVYKINQGEIWLQTSQNLGFEIKDIYGTLLYEETISWDTIRNYSRDAFVEATLYDALPERAIASTDPLRYRLEHVGKYKDTSIRWEQGKNSIELGEIYQYKYPLQLTSTRSNMLNIIYCIWIGLANNKKLSYPGQVLFYLPQEKPAFISDLSLYRFNIDFTPMLNGTISVAKGDSRSSKPSNQQSQIVDGEMWAKNQQTVLAKTSLPTTEITKKWTTWPSYGVGEKLNGAYIVGEKRRVNRTSIDCIYTVSEGYFRINQYTALDSRWRESSIDINNVVERDISLNDIVVLTEESVSNIGPSRIKNISEIANLIEDEGYRAPLGRIRTLYQRWPSNNPLVSQYASTSVRTIRTPASAISMGNTVRLSSPMLDHLAAGYKIENVDSKRTTRTLRYADSNGLIERVSLSWHEDNDFSTYYGPTNPSVNNWLAPRIYAPNLVYLKDSREKISFIQNIHFLRSPEIGFGTGMARYSPWTNPDSTKDFYFYNLNWEVKPLQNFIEAGQKGALSFAYNVSRDDNVYSFQVARDGSPAWAFICDETGEILFYSNSETGSGYTMYITRQSKLAESTPAVRTPTPTLVFNPSTMRVMGRANGSSVYYNISSVIEKSLNFYNNSVESLYTNFVDYLPNYRTDDVDFQLVNKQTLALHKDTRLWPIISPYQQSALGAKYYILKSNYKKFLVSFLKFINIDKIRIETADGNTVLLEELDTWEFVKNVPSWHTTGNTPRLQFILSTSGGYDNVAIVDEAPAYNLNNDIFGGAIKLDVFKKYTEDTTYTVFRNINGRNVITDIPGVRWMSGFYGGPNITSNKTLADYENLPSLSKNADLVNYLDYGKYQETSLLAAGLRAESLKTSRKALLMSLIPYGYSVTSLYGYRAVNDFGIGRFKLKAWNDTLSMLNELTKFQNEIEIRLSYNNLIFEVKFLDELFSLISLSTVKSGDLDITQELILMKYNSSGDDNTKEAWDEYCVALGINPRENIYGDFQKPAVGNVEPPSDFSLWTGSPNRWNSVRPSGKILDITVNKDYTLSRNNKAKAIFAELMVKNGNNSNVPISAFRADGAQIVSITNFAELIEAFPSWLDSVELRVKVSLGFSITRNYPVDII